MFFGENELNIELLGVFKIKRNNFNHKSFDNREYDSLSIRTSGNAKFFVICFIDCSIDFKLIKC